MLFSHALDSGLRIKEIEVHYNVDVPLHKDHWYVISNNITNNVICSRSLP